MPHGPTDHSMEGGAWFTPGAHLDTGAAAGPVFVAYPHIGAFFNRVWPFLVAVMENLITVTDRTGELGSGHANLLNIIALRSKNRCF